MFTLVLMLFATGPSDALQRFEWKYETAAQCVAARDWWIENRRTARPKGFEQGWQVLTLPNCYDRADEIVRTNTSAHSRLPTS